MKIQLADNLTLPADEAVSQKYAFLGRSGSGKTYGAMKLAELFLAADAQIIALDWVGNWWALRLGQDGRSSGCEGVYIFGGEHADVPLEVTSGVMMADLLVDKHISAVLDLSPFRKAERTRFATAFAEQLFHRKKTARTACHLFLEEAQAFLPQMVRGDDARMVGVFEDIGKVGRNYGIGVSILSQRPQAVNKDVLNQTEVLLAFQTNGPQERKTIGGWVVEHGDADVALVNELPTLPRGDAFVWSPQWLQLRRRVHIAARDTYDASSTPTQQARRVKPAALTPADLESLGEAMKATVERAKADDPRELRRQIVELKATVVRLEKQPKPTAAPERQPERIEVPVIRAEDLHAIADAVRTVTDEGKRLRQEIEAAFNAGVERVVRSMTPVLEAVGRATSAQMHARVAPPRAVKQYGQIDDPRRSSHSAPRRPAADASVTPAQQRLLNGLAFLHGIGNVSVDRTQLALLIAASPASSAYANNLGALRSAGLIDYPSGGAVALTGEGERFASTDGVPHTTADLHAAIQAKLPPAKWKILETLIAAYPHPVEKEALADQVRASVLSSAYANNLGSLRSLGLIDYPKPGSVKALPVLFLEER